MAIPKVIHYCWFGGNELSQKAVKCMESWKKYCPDWEIKEWNEQNYDVEKIPYIRDAYKEKKWAFVSDYVRLDVVWQYGGIYLDTDVELIKPLDFFLEEEVFFALEKKNLCINTGLGFGAVPENRILRQLMELYEKLSFYMEDGSLNLIACPRYNTEFFVKKGYHLKDITQRCEEAIIYGSEYFCPMDFNTGTVTITDNTYGIHWYEASWFPESDKRIHATELRIRKKYPESLANKICVFYRKMYRFAEYSRKGILSEKMKEKWKKR